MVFNSRALHSAICSDGKSLHLSIFVSQFMQLKSLASEEENVLWYSRRKEMLQEKLDLIRKQVTEHQEQLVSS